jgi:hypothetical protein
MGIMDKNDQKVEKLLLECGIQQRNCSEDKWQHVEKVMKSAPEEVVSREQRRGEIIGFLGCKAVVEERNRPKVK